MWINVLHSCIWVGGFLLALTIVAIAAPNSRLREFLYRVGEWYVNRRNDSF
jgi:uncharacterized membrane protein